MGYPRKDIVDENEVRTYHCITRCVRRAFLCGFDKYIKKSFEHRKVWIENRIKYLDKIFLIDIGAYTIMANHLHLILSTRPDLVKLLSDEEILIRWNYLYPSFRDKDGNIISIPEDEMKVLLLNKERISELRKRLSCVSWLMKCLNEYVARRANKEDNCKGKFWEGRFKCQLLLGEAAKLACMVYTELNPTRAGLGEKIENNKHTSIYLRIKSYKANQRSNEVEMMKKKKLNKQQRKLVLKEEENRNAAKWLAPIEESKSAFLKMELEKYISLVEWTGKQIKKNKRGSIPIELNSVFERLEIDKKKWLRCVKAYGSVFHRIAGRTEDIVSHAKMAGKKWFWGVKKIEHVFAT
jgi:hypothetical protein